MAQSFTSQILVDTNKRTVIKLVGQLDVTGETSNVKVIGSQLRGALAVDTNNAVLVSQGGAARTNYNYTLGRVYYDVWIPGGYMVLNWSGSTPSVICTCSGAFDQNFQDDLGVIPNSATSPTGNISFSSVGSVANTGYTIILELHKGPNSANANCDFDMGQIARPSDFNFGKFAVKP